MGDGKGFRLMVYQSIGSGSSPLEGKGREALWLGDGNPNDPNDPKNGGPNITDFGNNWTHYARP